MAFERARRALLVPVRGLGFLRRVPASPVWWFAVTRGGLMLVSFVVLTILPVRPERGVWRGFRSNLLLDGFMRWDAGWLKDIAAKGYEALDPQATAFFPLYPLLVRWTSKLGIADNYFVAGFLVNAACLLAAVILLHKIVTQRFGAGVAERTVVLLLVYPFSFFFSAPYVESVLLLCIVASFFCAERRYWLAAALFAGLASAAKATGVLTAVGIGLIYLEQRRCRIREVGWDALYLPLSVWGIAAYMVYLQLTFGDPLLFLKSQYVPGWAGSFGIGQALEVLGPLKDPRAVLGGAFSTMPFINLSFTAAAAVVLALTARRIPLPYLAWAGLMLVPTLRGWNVGGRLVGVVFPVFVGLALLLPEDGPLYQGWVVLSCFGLTTLMIVFSLFYWVA